MVRIENQAQKIMLHLLTFFVIKQEESGAVAACSNQKQNLPSAENAPRVRYTHDLVMPRNANEFHVFKITSVNDNQS
jgi:hypothetical protein